MLDIVGKFLTPVLFISLMAIGFKGFMSPIGSIARTASSASVVSAGILAGYQTMDVLGALIFGVIILKTVEGKGFTDVAFRNKIIGGACVVTGISLFLVYCGLAHLGATASGVFPPEISRVNLVTESVRLLFGAGGIAILSLMVALACLTTAIGLTSSAGTYLSRLTGEKVSYKVIVFGICVFSALVSTLGVEAIVKYAAIVLNLVYAPAVTLIFLTLAGKRIGNDNIFKGAAFGAFLFSLLDLELHHGPGLSQFILSFPFSHLELGWLLPAVLGGIIGKFI